MENEMKTRRETPAELLPYLKKLQTMPQMYVVFSASTNLPFISCDEENFHDQVLVYEREEDARERESELKTSKNKVMLMTIQGKDFLAFYTGMFSLGIDSIVLHEAPAEGEEKGHVQELELGTIVIQPDYSSLPENKRPIFNPQMQLTGVYFMQEYRREVPIKEKRSLQALEEEAIAAMKKCRFLVPIKKEEDGKVSAPCIKSDDGDVFQPIFTDMAEMHRYDKQSQFGALSVPYSELTKVVNPQAKGIVINPQGFCMAVDRNRLGQ